MTILLQVTADDRLLEEAERGECAYESESANENEEENSEIKKQPNIDSAQEEGEETEEEGKSTTEIEYGTAEDKVQVVQIGNIQVEERSIASAEADSGAEKQASMETLDAETAQDKEEKTRENEDKSKTEIEYGTAEDEVQVVQIDNVQVEESGIASAEVTEQSPTSSSDSLRCWENLPVATPFADTQQHAPESSSNDDHLQWWERLPVATPIFDAEVEVWDYSRPSFPNRFRKGFFGDRPPAESNEQAPRDPLFTDEDCANPFRCICKLVGVILTLPFYLLYLLFCDCRWVKPCCFFLDRIICRPVGMALDLVTFLIEESLWATYMVVLVPIYTILVYFERAIWNTLLYLAKGFLILIECYFRQIIVPIGTGIAMTCILINNNLLAPCAKVIRSSAVAICQGIGAIFLYTYYGIQKLFTCVSNNVFLPFYQGLIVPIGNCFQVGMKAIQDGIEYICSLLGQCFRSVWKNIIVASYKSLVAFLISIHEYILLPIWNGIKTIMTIIWNGIRHACNLVGEGFQFVWKSFIGCLQGIHQHILLPIGKAFTTVLMWIWKGIEYICKAATHVLFPAAKGIVSGVQYGYEHILVPIGKSVYGYIIQPIVAAVMAMGRFIRDTFVAIRNGVVSFGRACYQDMLVPIGQMVRAVFQQLRAFMQAVGQQVGAFMQAVGQQIQAVFAALTGIFK